MDGKGPLSDGQLAHFKDEKTKDAVTYHSWWLDMVNFVGQDLLPYVFHLLQGFLGDLDRGLGKDFTLSDILHTLDKHYGVVMKFDTLSKELYSLKQGLGVNVAEFWMCLLQQVQILQ